MNITERIQTLQEKDSKVEASTVEQAVSDAQLPLLVVLDDDPTGTQSVAFLPVISSWDEEDLRWAFSQGKSAVYVMTNTRSLNPEDTARINREVVKNSLSVASEMDIKVAFVSRSDSTLRGHFPLEPNTIASTLDHTVDGILLVPAFGDAGRVTLDGVHYLKNSDGEYIPVGESEYANDNTFGYESSSLPEWVEEKTGGEIQAGDVISIPIDVIRDNHDRVLEILVSAKNGQVIAPDIITETDLRLFSLAVIEATKQGKHFVHRVGPPYVRALIGMDEPEVLDSAKINELCPDRNKDANGLIVVGSHVPTTTRQLNHLIDAGGVQVVELNVPDLLDDKEKVISAVSQEVAAALTNSHVVFHTSREVVKGEDEEDSLRIARTVNEGLVEATKRAIRDQAPSFVIAKGGITSSDVAKHSLDIRHANVLGPLEPGIISVWLSDDGIAKTIPYVVFAGNVGSDESLKKAVEKLS